MTREDQKDWEKEFDKEFGFLDGTMNIKEAVDTFVKALKEDEQYYYSWQSNIAMSFVDEFNRKQPDGFFLSLISLDIHEVANKAAKNFLNMLITQQEKGK